eukprot:2831348-Amphidinium_carterae.1
MPVNVTSVVELSIYSKLHFVKKYADEIGINLAYSRVGMGEEIENHPLKGWIRNGCWSSWSRIQLWLTRQGLESTLPRTTVQELRIQ